MRKVALIVIALAIATIVAGAAGPAFAAASITADDLALVPGTGATLDPETGAVRVSVQPGGGVWQSATISNRGRVRFTVEVRGADGRDGDGTGAWVRPAVETLLIEPGKSVAVDYTVAPPADAERTDAPAQLVVAIVEAPEVRRSLDLMVSVLGPAVTEAPVADTPTDTPATRTPATAPADTGDRGFGETLVFALILAAIVALVVWTVFGPILRHVRARRGKPAAAPRQHAETAEDALASWIGERDRRRANELRTRTDAARNKATAARPDARAIRFVDPLECAVADVMVDATPARGERVRRKALDLDELNRVLNRD